MICKRCKTSVPAGRSQCPLCGEKTGNAKAKAQALIAVVLVIFIAGVVYLVLSLTGRLEPENCEEEIAITETETADGVSPVSTQTPETASTVSTHMPETGIEDSEEGQPQEELESEHNQVFAYLREAAKAAANLLNHGLYVTNKGFLYDVERDDFVRASDMVWDAPLDGAEIKPMLLYLRPMDFMTVGLRELAGDGSEELRVYVAFSITADEIAVSDVAGAAGILYKDRWNTVLGMYENEHGEVRTPEEDGDVYAELPILAASYTFSSMGYDIRWVKQDDKYAFAIMYDHEAALLRAFVFRRDLEGWMICLSELEQAENLRVAVNRALPDFNPKLLPLFPIDSEMYAETGEESLVDVDEETETDALNN